MQRILVFVAILQFLPQGQTTNYQYYEKRFEKITRKNSQKEITVVARQLMVPSLYNNASAHSALSIRKFCVKNQMTNSFPSLPRSCSLFLVLKFKINSQNKNSVQGNNYSATNINYSATYIARTLCCRVIQKVRLFFYQTWYILANTQSIMASHSDFF